MRSVEPMARLGIAGACALVFAVMSGPASAQNSPWQIPETTVLAIGSTNGIDPMYSFQDIRGVGLVDDTLVLVADGGSNQLRIYALDGRFLRSFGGRGDGPEEFRGIAWAEVCDDAIVVFDYARQRATVWDVDGRLLDGFRVEGTRNDLPPYSVSCGPNRDFAVLGWPDVMATPVAVGPYRPQVAVGLADSHGQLVKVLASVPGSERYRYPSNDGPRRLGKTTIARMGAGMVYVGTADSFRVQILRPDGDARSFGRPSERVPFTRKMRRDWENGIVRRTQPDMRPAARRALEALEMPESLPAFADLRLDVLGFVWIEHYPIPGDGGRDQWDVFDPEGAFLALVQMPKNFSPREIGLEYVLGVGRAEDGVESVQLFRLQRGAQP